MVDSWWLTRANALVDQAESWQWSSEWKLAGDEIQAAINGFKQLQREPVGYYDSDRPSIAAGMWDRLMRARETFRSRRTQYFDALDAAAADHARDKRRMCAHAESVMDSDAWSSTAREIRELQQQWKTVGSARREEDALWQRFRTAVDHFFAQRSNASQRRIAAITRLDRQLSLADVDAVRERARAILRDQAMREPAILPDDRLARDELRSRCRRILDADEHPRRVRQWIALAQLDAWIYENPSASAGDIEQAYENATALRLRLTRAGRPRS